MVLVCCLFAFDDWAGCDGFHLESVHFGLESWSELRSLHCILVMLEELMMMEKKKSKAGREKLLLL